MEILVNRVARKDTYTIGKLFVNNIYECDTLEDKDRDANKNGVFDNGETKVYSETAIPNGRYKIILAHSPKFSPKVNNRKMPLLENVPSFTGVLIHWGNTAADSAGCILVGVNNAIGRVNNSKETFLRLLDKIEEADKRGESIWITIK